MEISLRGVSTTDTTSKGDQDIVYSLDGVAIGRPEEMGISFFDIDRIEVLRGPQGTLYGKSSTGGAINVITNKPTDTYQVSASLDIGNYDTHRDELMVNIPIASNFAIRAAGSFNQQDGFIKETQDYTGAGKAPVLGSEDDATGRIEALWKFDDTGSALLTGNFGHIGGTGIGQALYDPATGKINTHVYYNPYGGGSDDNFDNISLELNQDFGPVHVTYIGADMLFKAHDLYAPSTDNPYANNAAGAYNWGDYFSHVSTVSHELRFSNAHPEKLEWVVGANYYDENNMEHDQNWTASLSCAPSLSAACNSANPVIVGPTDHKSEGLFGQVNYHMTDKLTLTLGLRESKDSVKRTATIAAGPGPFYDASGAPCAPPNDCVAGNGLVDDTGSESSSGLTYRVGAQYQMTPRQMIYASVATGYKGGGFNDYDPTTHTTEPYDPAKLTAYEIGYKGRPVDNLTYNSSLYYYDYQKYQVTAATMLGFGPTGPVIFIYTKSAPVTMYGWENEITWHLDDNDNVGFELSLERAYYSGPLTVGFLVNNQVNWRGKSLDAAPDVSGTAYWQHYWTLGNGGELSFKADTKYSGKYYESSLGGSSVDLATYLYAPTQYAQKAFTRSNLTLTYTSPDDKYTITGYVHNLENKIQITSAPQAATASTVDNWIVRVSDPETFGVRVGVKY